VYAHEIGCTGNGHINGAKILELVINRGRDLKSGKMIGVDTGEIKSYGELVSAFKEQLRYAVSNCIGAISRVERRYPDIYADTILSSMLEECIKAGADAYAGAARYNNSSLYLYGIATIVDSLAAAKRLAFDEGGIGWERLCEILRNDWQGEERLRIKALRLPEKYGNNEPLANSITADISHFFASLVNGVPNGRGGVFKASNFTINKYVSMGKLTMATPDGRHAGDFISKNLSPTNGMDKKGITAVIDSVTNIDFSEYANGSVLDVVMHPSAVTGEDGLEAMYALLRTFFDKGGIAMHGNVFDADTLRAARENPEKYKNLQVRVCGWNAYFVNLSEEEQADFIAKCENL
jgi:formate C-acetyltransferase